jgi:hypothetical protein
MLALYTFFSECIIKMIQRIGAFIPMKISHMFLIAAGIIAIQPATAADNSGATSADGDKKICRRIETTGSIMPGKRVCRTKSEWAQIDRANGNNAERTMTNMRRGGNQPQ